MTRAEEMVVSHGRTLEGFDHEGCAGTRRALRARTRAPAHRLINLGVIHGDSRLCVESVTEDNSGE